MALEFRCEDVGVVCKGKVTADSEEELIGKVAEHAAAAHGVGSMSDTLVRYAASTVKSTGSPGKDDGPAS